MSKSDDDDRPLPPDVLLGDRWHELTDVEQQALRRLHRIVLRTYRRERYVERLLIVGLWVIVLYNFGVGVFMLAEGRLYGLVLLLLVLLNLAQLARTYRRRASR